MLVLIAWIKRFSRNSSLLDGQKGRERAVFLLPLLFELALHPRSSALQFVALIQEPRSLCLSQSTLKLGKAEIKKWWRILAYSHSNWVQFRIFLNCRNWIDIFRSVENRLRFKVLKNFKSMFECSTGHPRHYLNFITRNWPKWYLCSFLL